MMERGKRDEKEKDLLINRRNDLSHEDSVHYKNRLTKAKEDSLNER